MEHSELFSQPADVIEYNSSDASQKPVENPVFSDLPETHSPGTHPASS
jgi:hypothetical protein